MHLSRDREMTAFHLVKCYDLGLEDDWNRFLMAPLRPLEHRSPDFSIIEDYAIYAVIGTRGLGHVPASFFERLSHVNGKGLYHLGDEFLAGGYELYRHFDFVIRNHYAGALSGDGIETVPLGYPVGMASDGSEGAASERPLAWCFLGNVNAARAEMIAAFRQLRPHRLHVYRVRKFGEPVARDEYRSILRSSMFVPCPMGNVMLETWRLYEALEAAAIPLISRRTFMPYHDLVMPGHPIPTFTNWAKARRFAERLIADPRALDALQTRIVEWWQAYKATLQSRVSEFVMRGFSGAFREALVRWPPRTGVRLQTWRAVELLKHHNVVAARGRLELTVSRMARTLLSSSGS